MRQKIKKDSETPDLNPSKSLQDALPGALLSPCHMDPVCQVGIFVLHDIEGGNGVLSSKAKKVGLAWICMAETGKGQKCWRAVKNADKFALIFKNSDFVLSPSLLDEMISFGPRYDCGGFGYYFQKLGDSYHSLPGNSPSKEWQSMFNTNANKTDEPEKTSHNLNETGARVENGYVKD